MFETAVIRSRAADRHFGFLSLSVTVHTAAVIAVIAASLNSTRLPQEAPKQMMPVFFERPVTLPPALGTPAPARPAPPRRAAPQVAPSVQTAPVTIPSTIPAPAAQVPQLVPVTTNEATEPDSSDSSIGVPGGKKGGIGTEAPPAPDATGPLTISGGVKAPVVIRRVEPIYPPMAVRARINGWVVLQCIIDKSGRIRDVRVVNSSFAAFEQPAVDAVQQWLFSPGTLNQQPVDTIFELTVKFQVR